MINALLCNRVGAFMRCRDLFAVLLGLCGLAASQAAVLRCADRIGVNAAVLSNGFGFNLANTRQQDSALTADNVARLRLVRTHVAPGSIEKRGAPVLTAQTVYFTEGTSLVAGDRQSGCEHWRYDGAAHNKPLLGSSALRSSPIYVPPRGQRRALVLVGDFNGVVYAVDAQSGQEVWQRFLGTDPSQHMITGSPQVHEGVMYLPVASKEVVSTVLSFFSPCCTSHGLLQAVDVYTGRILWTYHTAPPAAYSEATGMSGPSGMSIWGAPLVDPTRRQVLVGTGQNLSRPATANSDAIIALDMATGREKWVFQAVKGDTWNAACQAPSILSRHCPHPAGADFDFGAPPVLATLPQGGQLVLAGSKNGTVYALDPDTGKLRWSQAVGVGGSLGGIHWGLAVDGERVYAGVTDVWVNKMSRLAIGELISGGLLSNMAQVPGGHPGVYALDLATGRVLWARHIQHRVAGKPVDSLFSAALSVSNDVVWAASLDGTVHALRSRDGQPLWSYDTAVAVTDANGVAGHGGTTDSVGPVPQGRELYVNSGYNTFGGANAWQGGPGNVLFVFRLP